MAVTRYGNFIRMTENGDEVTGKMYVQSIMWACAAANHTVQLATGPDDFLFVDARGSQHMTTQLRYEPALMLEIVKVIEKQTASAITIVLV